MFALGLFYKFQLFCLFIGSTIQGSFQMFYIIVSRPNSFIITLAWGSLALCSLSSLPVDYDVSFFRYLKKFRKDQHILLPPHIRLIPVFISIDVFPYRKPLISHLDPVCHFQKVACRVHGWAVVRRSSASSRMATRSSSDRPLRFPSTSDRASVDSCTRAPIRLSSFSVSFWGKNWRLWDISGNVQPNSNYQFVDGLVLLLIRHFIKTHLPGGPASQKGLVIEELTTSFGFMSLSVEDIVFQFLPTRHSGTGTQVKEIQEALKVRIRNTSEARLLISEWWGHVKYRLDSGNDGGPDGGVDESEIRYW